MKKKREKEIVEKYCTPIGGGRYVTTTKDGVFLCLHTTRPTRPLYKRLTNYVIEYDKEDKESR